MATVQITNPHGPIDPVRLTAFETALGAELPGDYRQFLLTHNGGELVPSEIILPGQAEPFATMGPLFGLYDGQLSLETLRENVEGLLPVELLAFGEDAGGNLLCIGICGEHRAKVYFWDHHRSFPGADKPNWAGMTLMAPSFAKFVAALGGPQPGTKEFGLNNG